MKLSKNTKSVINTHRMMSGEFIHEPDQRFPLDELLETIGNASGEVSAVPATALATSIFGDTLSANMIMLGCAYQLGALPIPGAAIEKAIELNGRDVDTNINAFRLGRQMGADPKAGDTLLGSTVSPDRSPEQESEQALLERRMGLLQESHGPLVTTRLSAWITTARQHIDRENAPAMIPALIESGFRVLYEKDEYEVARLYSEPQFRQSLGQEFEGDFKLRVYLAPPMLSRIDPDSGRPIMRSFGPWIFTAFRILSALKWMRGRWCDPFRYSSERQLDRRIQAAFERTLDLFGEFGINRDNVDTALRMARWPMNVRGYGPVRAEAFEKAMKEFDILEAEFRGDVGEHQKAA